MLDKPNLKVLCWQPSFQSTRQLSDVFYSRLICIKGKDLASFSQQMHQIAAISTSGVKDTHSGANVSSQNLIKNIDIDLPKLILNV